jgi:hypothetical protein
MKLLIVQSSPFSCYALNLGSSLRLTDQVSHPHKTTCKIILLHILIFTISDLKRKTKNSELKGSSIHRILPEFLFVRVVLKYLNFATFSPLYCDNVAHSDFKFITGNRYKMAFILQPCLGPLEEGAHSQKFPDSCVLHTHWSNPSHRVLYRLRNKPIETGSKTQGKEKESCVNGRLMQLQHNISCYEKIRLHGT